MKKGLVLLSLLVLSILISACSNNLKNESLYVDSNSLSSSIEFTFIKGEYESPQSVIHIAVSNESHAPSMERRVGGTMLKRIYDTFFMSRQNNEIAEQITPSSGSVTLLYENNRRDFVSFNVHLNRQTLALFAKLIRGVAILCLVAALIIRKDRQRIQSKG